MEFEAAAAPFAVGNLQQSLLQPLAFGDIVGNAGQPRDRTRGVAPKVTALLEPVGPPLVVQMRNIDGMGFPCAIVLWKSKAKRFWSREWTNPRNGRPII